MAAATFGGNGSSLGGSLDPKTGIHTYADGSTYQNPYQYGDSWSYVPGQTGQAVAAPQQTYQTKPDVFNGGGQGGAVWGGSAPSTQPAQYGGALTDALKASNAAMNSGTGGAGAVGNISSYTAGQNPYLQQQADALTRTVTNNLNNSILPGISAASIANGNFGGSRQGVIEANALNDANGQIASGLASLLGNGYNNALQYDLGRRSQDQSYNLGLGNLGLGAMNAQNNYDLGLRNNALGIGNLDYQYANLDRQIYNDNSNRQLQGAQLGLQAYNQGQQNNQGAISAGTSIQNTPYNYWSNFSNGANAIGNGYGTTTGSTSNQGNPFLGALGGAHLGASIFGGGGSSGTGMSAGYAAPYQVGSYDYSLGTGGGGLGLRFP